MSAKNSIKIGSKIASSLFIELVRQMFKETPFPVSKTPFPVTETPFPGQELIQSKVK